MAKNSGQKSNRIERDRMRGFEARQEQYNRRVARRRRDNILWSSIAGAVILLVIGSQIGFAVTNSHPSSSASPSSSTSTGLHLPSPSFAAGKTWTLSVGLNNAPLMIELDGKKAPQAVASTVYLAESNFYKGLTCHRLTTAGIYVLQCGDPKGDGTGGPGYSYGPIENAPSNNVYPAGTIAMARQSNNASSQGSQFFIVYKDSTIPSDSVGGYTVIGTVKTGLSAVLAIAKKGVAGGGTDGSPATKVTMNYFAVLP